MDIKEIDITEKSMAIKKTKNVDRSHTLNNHVAPNHIINDLRETVLVIMSQDGLHVGNILNMATTLMSTTGKYRKLKGHEKKELVVLAINEAIELYVEDELIEDALQTMVRTVIPSAIDLMIDISKKRVKFKNAFCC